MLRFAIVLFFLTLLIPARSEIYTMDRYNATVNLPDGESWFRRGGPALPSGEFAVFAINAATKAHFGVAVIPGFPTTDIRHATVLNRMLEVMRTFAIEPQRQRFADQEGLPYIEIIGATILDSGESFVAVARGILKDNFLYVTIHIKPGVDADADHVEFMSNIETLRFDAKPRVLNFNIATTIPKLVPWHYRAYRAGAAMAVLLMIGFLVMLLVSRRPKEN